MPSNYLPARDAQLVTWTGEFLTNITADPTRYGLTAVQATAYEATRTVFVEAYSTVNNPITRTPPNFEVKNAAKRSLVSATRALVDVCQSWPQMTNELRRELKITERGKRPVPSPRPGMPFVKVVSVDGRNVKLCIQQSSTTDRRPKGVEGANVMVAYADVAPTTTTTAWAFVAATGRTTLTVTLDGVPEACTAWITAFWFNGRKETGQAANPIPVALPAISAGPVAMKLTKAA